MTFLKLMSLDTCFSFLYSGKKNHVDEIGHGENDIEQLKIIISDAKSTLEDLMYKKDLEFDKAKEYITKAKKTKKSKEKTKFNKLAESHLKRKKKYEIKISSLEKKIDQNEDLQFELENNDLHDDLDIIQNKVVKKMGIKYNSSKISDIKDRREETRKIMEDVKDINEEVIKNTEVDFNKDYENDVKSELQELIDLVEEEELDDINVPKNHKETIKYSLEDKEEEEENNEEENFEDLIEFN